MFLVNNMVEREGPPNIFLNYFFKFGLKQLVLDSRVLVWKLFFLKVKVERGWGSQPFSLWFLRVYTQTIRIRLRSTKSIMKRLVSNHSAAAGISKSTQISDIEGDFVVHLEDLVILIFRKNANIILKSRKIAINTLNGIFFQFP